LTLKNIVFTLISGFKEHATFVVSNGDDVRRALDISYVIIKSCVCGDCSEVTENVDIGCTVCVGLNH